MLERRSKDGVDLVRNTFLSLVGNIRIAQVFSMKIEDQVDIIYPITSSNIFCGFDRLASWNPSA